MKWALRRSITRGGGGTSTLKKRRSVMAVNNAKFRRMKFVELAQRLYEVEQELADITDYYSLNGLGNLELLLKEASRNIQNVRIETERWLDILEPYCEGGEGRE